MVGEYTHPTGIRGVIHAQVLLFSRQDIEKSSFGVPRDHSRPTARLFVSVLSAIFGRSQILIFFHLHAGVLHRRTACLGFVLIVGHGGIAARRLRAAGRALQRQLKRGLNVPQPG